MAIAEPRTYGPTHLTLAQCREQGRPTVVQSLAAHIVELQADNARLRQQVGDAGTIEPPKTGA